jgi:hypothetical protein
VAIVLGFVNAIIRPILVILTLPATILTLGLFIFVINGLLFWAVGSFWPGFHVAGFWAACSCASCTASSRGSVGDLHALKKAADGGPRRHVQLRVLPAEDAGRCREARARARSSSQLRPAFCSVTFGAGGSTREGTLETCARCSAKDGFRAAHLVHRRQPQSLRDVLSQYAPHGVDARGGAARRPALGVCRRGRVPYASDLVTFIREEAADHFHVDVACYPEYHPQARSPQEDLDHFERKVRAAPTPRSRSTSSTAMPTGASWTRAPRAHRDPDRARHHADPLGGAPRAIFRRMRRGDPALDPTQAGRIRRRHGLDPRVSGSTW